MKTETVTLKIKRQNTPSGKPYWETFETPKKPLSNIISCLQEIQRAPVTADGKRVNPWSGTAIAWKKFADPAPC